VRWKTTSQFATFQTDVLQAGGTADALGRGILLDTAGKVI